MGRAVVAVKQVDADMHSQFIELWITHRVESGTTPEAAQRLALDGTLRTALQRDDIAAYLSFVDGAPAGYVVLADSTRSLLVDSPCVSIDMLYVHPDHRRSGVGRALLAAAGRHADRTGAEHLSSAVPASNREANRFFARLGFAPETVRRVTSTALLQRKLAGEPRSQRYGLDQVLQRRRDLRTAARRASARTTPRTSTGAAPAQPPQVAG
ncbi:GNAT family N-acetyltransferase [Terracoccus luteus]|jgi:GNAT superfamily N-acetyltransferase|uniref:GNAT superfamily N-acetyltransferase n=1 Tax=Terracoccus luteus TaxID=53356 RepID=A0A839PUH2_9MICO|nr:GNAT family N-acetyltransferase [Terracoccus luteus]MBB2987780.1 GNAT superfamily N-acetyltransferase [Terracoccus luteus]MCP2173431.1 GNAT superfamily N-acetyltransferase [Terracoccus luteus]